MMTQDKPTTPPVVVAVRAAARKYHVPYTTLLQWIQKGKLTELWEGDTRVVLEAEVLELLAARLEGKPQAREVLGDYVRGDKLETQPAADSDRTTGR